jgi:hypothetical protein
MAPFVSCVDELEEEVSAARHDREIADLVDNKQGGAAQIPDPLAQLPFAFGFRQRSDDVGERGEVDALSGLHGLDGKGCRQMAFAGAGRAEKMDHLRPLDELQLGQRHDAVFIERWLEGEVEAGERLDGGQPGHHQDGLDASALA